MFPAKAIRLFLDCKVCGAVSFSTPSSMARCAEDTHQRLSVPLPWLLLITLEAGTLDVASSAVGRGPAHRHQPMGSSNLDDGIGGVLGGGRVRDSPPWVLESPTFPSIFKQSQTECLLLSSAQIEPRYLSADASPCPCFSFFSRTTNKGRLIAGMEKPMVWSHKYRSRLGWGRSSFLICLFKDKEALSVHMGSSNLTINYINGCQKVPGLLSWLGRDRTLGSHHSGPSFPNPLNLKVLSLKCLL